MVQGVVPWKSSHPGSRPGATPNTVKQVLSHFCVIVSASVKCSVWTRWYLKSTSISVIMQSLWGWKHTQTPPLYYVLTLHRLTEKNKLPFQAVTSLQAAHNIALAFNLLLFSHNSACHRKQNCSFHRVIHVCFLSHVSLRTTTLLDPSWVYALNLNWDTVQANK